MDAQQIAIRLYSLTLRCFPAEHRHEWAEVMVATFEEMVRDAYHQSGLTGLIAIWLNTFFDTLKVSVIEHIANNNRGHSGMNDLTQINNYRVQNMLGEGGSATVYRVQDNNGVTAVLKLFNRTNALEHFDRESDNLGRINHPAAPRLLGSGTYGKHKYCVIELIEGESWETKLETNSTSISQAIEWAMQICDFLSYLHDSQRLLIHRSLKPANIMVQNDGRIRVLDYDIMEQYSQNQNYPLIGTQGYSAPEQYAGRSDPRSDIYALGASLYHLVTKRDPRTDAPFLFHFYPPCSLNPQISEALEAVILKAVEHKPEDRFQSALAMREALEKCLTN